MVVQALGFIVGWEKSELTPTHSDVSGRCDRSVGPARPPDPGGNRDGVGVGSGVAAQTVGPRQDLVKVHGLLGEPCEYAPRLPAAHEASADARTASLPPPCGHAIIADHGTGAIAAPISTLDASPLLSHGASISDRDSRSRR